MLLNLLLNFLKAWLYILWANIFWKQKRQCLKNIKNVIAGIGLTLIGYMPSRWNVRWLHSANVIIVILIIVILGLSVLAGYKLRTILAGAVEAYILTFFINVFFAIACGGISYSLEYFLSLDYRYMLAIVVRIGLIVLIWRYFDWLKAQTEKFAMHIMLILGAFSLFFQQLIQLAVGNKDDIFLVVLTLLVYLTMIFTVIMNLQHSRLTAHNAAIEEDNRAMSKQLHRSKDVLNVVSHVVATEETIDPKLRQELADFCSEEMHEMRDTELSAGFIGDTGMELVNVMLQKWYRSCAEKRISADMMIPAPIAERIRDIGIPEAVFMRMTNDLLKNAVHAIERLDSEVRSRELLLIMGVGEEGCLELRIYDSGIPFAGKILERFGERGNTTDGTGNGLADTIATLKQYDASLYLEQYEPDTDIYTKCIHILFDHRAQMKIC